MHPKCISRVNIEIVHSKIGKLPADGEKGGENEREKGSKREDKLNGQRI